MPDATKPKPAGGGAAKGRKTSAHSTEADGYSLAVAARAHNVTMLSLEPGHQHGTEFIFPEKSSALTPSVEHYHGWAPGKGLALVTGIIAVININMTGRPLLNELGKIRSSGMLIVAEVETPTGGMHVWVPGDDSLIASSWENSHGRVSLLTDGQLAFVPGCTRGSGTYRFVKEPEWTLLEPSRAARGRAALHAYVNAGIENDRVKRLKSDANRDANLPGFDTKMGEDDFWGARDYLAHVKHQAWANITDPYAVLLATLCRVSAEMHPRLVMPGGFGGTQMSTSFFGCIVGESGQGKSGAMRTAGNLFRWSSPRIGLTSGEGLISGFAHVKRDKDGGIAQVLHTTNAFVSVDEGEFLASVDERKSNTTFPVLRTLWSDGGGVAINNRDVRQKLSLDAYSVQLGLIVGAQPQHLGRLFEDSAGTAERFVMQLAAGHIPPRGHGFEPLANWGLPARWDQIPEPGEGELFEFIYDHRISALLQETRYRALEEQSAALALLGHRQALVAKIACLLAAWDGRLDVGYEDWQLAVHFEAVSREARRAVGAELVRVNESKTRARGEARGRQEVHAEDAKAREWTGKAAQSIVDRVNAADTEVRASAIRRSLTPNQRSYFETALETCVAQGKISVVERPDSSGRDAVGVVEWLSPGPNA